MQELLIKKLEIDNACEKLDEANKILENNTNLVSINTINWQDYKYMPDVKFRIAHTNNEILLKFYVIEKNPKALETKTNGNVYKDSCVEFFLSPSANGYYYNFEFNCIGTAHLAYGKNRNDRKLLDKKIVQSIKAKSSLGEKALDLNDGNKAWNMLLIIPKSTMINDKTLKWSGLKAKGNFYKCGDETTEMHFVTWNPIVTEKPDYHQYSFFGDLIFE